MGKFRREYLRSVVAHGKLGKSVASFAAKIGVSPTTVRKWREKKAEFAEACEMAEAHALAFWERKLLEASKCGKKVNGGIVRYVLSGRFGHIYSQKGSSGEDERCGVEIYEVKE